MLIEMNALYFFDLLSFCVSLHFGDEKHFHQMGKLNVYTTHENSAVIGLEQAVAFLKELDESSQSFDELTTHLTINPLVKTLGIDLSRLKSFSKQLGMQAVPEGQVLPADSIYMALKGPIHFLPFFAQAMDRIVKYQTHVAEDAMKFSKLAHRMKEQTGGAPKFLNMGSMRLYNPTLSAYFARARCLGGFERFLDPKLKVAAEASARKSTPVNSWYLNSKKIAHLLAGRENTRELEAIASPVHELHHGGVHLLPEPLYTGSELLSFVLDGEVPNTIAGCEPGKINVLKRGKGYFLDSFYQSIFSVNFLSSKSLYGRGGVSKVSYLNEQAKGFLRAKRFKIPQILIRTHDQIEKILSQVQQNLPECSVYLRGQPKHYDSLRPEIVKELFYGDARTQELSLPTAASRTDFDFDAFYPHFQMQIQGLLYSEFNREKFLNLKDDWKDGNLGISDPDFLDVHTKWQKLFGSYEWDLLVMALAQHYSIPTHGLDITTSVDVAVWFALNKWYSYKNGEKKYAWYRPLERNSESEIGNYPVIYLVATDKNLKRDLDQVEFAKIPALRPLRQNAFLHFGGWGLHKNICAEDVVVALHLSEEYNPPSLFPTEWLFPSRAEDKFYDRLLSLKEDALKNGLNDGYGEIWEYRPQRDE